MKFNLPFRGAAVLFCLLASLSAVRPQSSTGYPKNLTTSDLPAKWLESVTDLQPAAAGPPLAWGNNQAGNLGIGSEYNYQPTPVQVTAAVTLDTVEVSGNNSSSYNSSSRTAYTLFLKPNGTVYGAGNNDNANLGIGFSGGYYLTPIQTLNLTGITQLSAGGRHASALRSDGTVWSWGDNNNGQTGNGTASGLPTTVPTQSSITDVVQVEAGGLHILALKSDGTVWAWGYNSYGQLGDATTIGRRSPVRVGANTAGFQNIIAISAGQDHSLALKSDGTVWVWGDNQYGQHGLGTSSGMATAPVQITSLSNVTQISAGGRHSVARKTDGFVVAWGMNGSGQLGLGATTSGGCYCVPTPVTISSLANVIDIEAGGDHTLARMRDGSIRAWGYNWEGTVGNGTRSTTSPNAVATPVTSLAGVGNTFINAGTGSFALKPQIATPAGGTFSTSGSSLTVNFASVQTAGQTSFTAIDPTTTGLTVPAGYLIEGNAPAYEISTTAQVSGDIIVCFKVPSVYSAADFSYLKILHGEGSALVDRTYSSTFIRRRLCAKVTSLSPFVIAKGLAPTAANATVSGRVVTAEGRGIVNVRVHISDAAGEIRSVITGPFGYYSFENVTAGSDYMVSVIGKRHNFAQATRLIRVDDDIANVDFTALP